MSLEFPTKEPSTIRSVWPHAAPEWMCVTLWQRSHDRSENDERKKPRNIRRPGKGGRRVIYIKGTTVIEAETMAILADILGVSPKAVSYAFRHGGMTKGGIVKAVGT